MNERADIFGGEECYLSGESEVKFVPNSVYTSTLTWSDGSQYYGTVNIQSKDLYHFQVPASQSRTQGMTVYSQDTDRATSMRIEIYYKFRTDTSSGAREKILAIANPSSNSFTIDKSYFATNQGTIYEVDPTLVSEIKGATDPHFPPGSSTLSNLTATRDVIIN